MGWRPAFLRVPVEFALRDLVTPHLGFVQRRMGDDNESVGMRVPAQYVYCL